MPPGDPRWAVFVKSLYSALMAETEEDDSPLPVIVSFSYVLQQQ